MSCYQAYPGYDNYTYGSFLNAVDFAENNNQTVPLLQEVLRSCDQRGVTCLPGCQAAIDDVINCGHPSVSTEKEMQYLFYTLISRDIDNYERFASGMRSCTPLPVLVIDTDVDESVNQTVDLVLPEICMLGSSCFILTQAYYISVIVPLLTLIVTGV